MSVCIVVSVVVVIKFFEIKIFFIKNKKISQIIIKNCKIKFKKFDIILIDLFQLFILKFVKLFLLLLSNKLWKFI